MECAPIGIIGHKQCCRPLGGACTNPGQFEECCAVGEGGDPVMCPGRLLQRRDVRGVLLGARHKAGVEPRR
jgi:hypothetical protein